ncbi:MAG: ABC transporter ATP-binding protein [Polyangiaceae bacterium]
MVRKTQLSLRDVGKDFSSKGGTVEALRGVSLDVGEGEFVSLIGGSGCGKSTLLRLAAGLEQPSAGEVLFEGQQIRGPGLERGVVFQDHRLLPWLTVWDNIAFALPDAKRTDAQATIQRHLELVGLQGFERSFPGQLSGGMSQRASLARALVNRPKLLLLDEPFGALDALTRMQQQQEILRIWELERVSMLLVTHDIDEAIFLSDRVIVLSPRPGTVRRTLGVPLPRPRQRNSTDFAEFRRIVYRELFGDEEALLDYVI